MDNTALVFVMMRIFRNSHRRIFDIDRLVNNGHQVIFLSFCDWNGYSSTVKDPYLVERTIFINSDNDIRNFVNEYTDRNALFITNVDSPRTFHHHFNLLKKHPSNQILGYSTRMLPSLSDLSIRKLLSYEATRLLFSRPILKRLLSNFSSNKVKLDFLLVGTLYQAPFYTNFSNTKIISVHIDDVNQILLLQKENQPVYSGRYGVFTDQLIPFAYKQLYSDRERDKYYKNLSDFIEYQRVNMGLDIIYFAAHPEIDVYSKQYDFSKYHFNIVKNDIVRLIKDSTIVFTHFSTTIGIAVYFNKPIHILIDNRLKEYKRVMNRIEVISALLSSPITNLDNYLESDSKIVKVTVNNALYSNYKIKYLKDNEIQEHSYYHAIRTILKLKG
jgi:hypothetical protein